MQVNAYLNFNGNCQEALEYYERTLGGKIEYVLRASDTPAAQQVPAGFADKVMHGRINIAGQTIMVSDCPPEHYQQPQGFRMNLSVKDPSQAERLFATLAEGGQVCMPIAETFWAQRFGMLTDRFGTPWMVNCEKAVYELDKVAECTAGAAR